MRKSKLIDGGAGDQSLSKVEGNKNNSKIK